MERVERGEIRWCRFDQPNKTRPVLVLTRDSAIPYLAEVVVAEITTRVRGIPSEVPLSTREGMPLDCAVNLDHVRVVRKDRLGKLLTVAPYRTIKAVRVALLFALGFDDR